MEEKVVRESRTMIRPPPPPPPRTTRNKSGREVHKRKDSFFPFQLASPGTSIC